MLCNAIDDRVNAIVWRHISSRVRCSALRNWKCKQISPRRYTMMMMQQRLLARDALRSRNTNYSDDETPRDIPYDICLVESNTNHGRVKAAHATRLDLCAEQHPSRGQIINQGLHEF